MSDLDDIGLYVPARNAAATLEPCLEAIARLDPAPREVVVVVNPASHDGTVAIARGRRGIRVVEQRRRGLPAARNEALRALEAPWVASVDADVVVNPSWLGLLAAARARFGQAAGIAGRTEERIAGLGDLWRALMHPHHWGAHPVDGPFMIVSEALLQRERVLEVGGYRESLVRYGDDSRLSRDLRDAGHRLAYVPGARGLHVRHDDILGALDLRWAYARPRMDAWLADLAGLHTKTARNLEYGRIAVARGRAAGVPELAAAGAFLPLHHALLDLRAMLQDRGLAPSVIAGAVAISPWPSPPRSTTPRDRGAPGWDAIRLGADRAPHPLPWPRWPAHARQSSSTCGRGSTRPTRCWPPHPGGPRQSRPPGSPTGRRASAVRRRCTWPRPRSRRGRAEPTPGQSPDPAAPRRGRRPPAASGGQGHRAGGGTGRGRGSSGRPRCMARPTRRRSARPRSS